MTRLKTHALALILLVGFGSLGEGSVLSESSGYYTDAYLNMSDGGYVDASSLTSGGARPWYLSPVVQKVYGGVPNASQRDDFVRSIFARTDASFEKSGLSLSLTNNPNDPAPHTLSVVSGTGSSMNPNAVGMTYIGGNGFTFIDGLKYAKTVDELEWAVAHNVAHELMHAFGGGHHDATGQHLDSARTDWETLVDPDATFSPDAVRELSAKNFRGNGYLYASPYAYGGFQLLSDDHGSSTDLRELTTLIAPVPEPATLALWGLIGLGGCLLRSSRRRRLA